jgi:hypothetical protein
VLLLDRTGWHTTRKLNIPENITPIFLTELALKHRLRSDDAIIDAACNAWRN